MIELEVYKKSDFYEDYISSQKEYYERANADAYFAERLAEKDREIAKLKEKLMPCLNGDCILTCEVVEKYGKENAELKADVNNLLMQNRELCQALQAMYSAEEYMKLQAEKDREIALLKERICNGDVSRLTWIDDCIAKDKEIAELKQKLEDVNELVKESKELLKESQKMHQRCADNASKQIRRLKRALYKACAEWALSTLSWLDCIDQGNPVKWGEMRWKCLKKAEEYHG